MPVPVKALDRVRRAGGALVRSVAPRSGRRRLREPPLVKGRALADRMTELAAALTGVNDELDLLAARARMGAAERAGVSRHGRARPCRVGRARTRSAGRPWTSRGACARRSGRADRPRSSSRPRSRRKATSASSVTGSACVARASSLSARRSTSASRHCFICRTGCPIRGSATPLAAWPRRRPSSASCPSGRALVLTSSYRTLEAVAERLRGQIGHELLVQGEAPRERLLERFREDVSSVLVATGTFWQGVDIPGEVAVAARHRQAAVPASRRSASGSPLRAHPRRGRRLVRVVRPAVGRASASSGLRPADPEPRRPGSRRDPRPADPHATLRTGVPRLAAAVPHVEERADVREFLASGAPVAS